MSDRADDPQPDQTLQHPDPVTDAALDWFVRLQEAPDDLGLKARLEDWLDSDPRHAAAFAKLQNMWELPELGIASARHASRLDARQEERTPMARVPVYRSGSWTIRIVALAAMVMIAAGIRYYPEMLLRWNADHLTATGEQSAFVLPDGSRILLNTASAVALDFEGQKRSVTLLRGEAFFDVISDPARPFRVAGFFGDVEVKGTAFSVRTGGEDTVILERGRVEVAQRAHEAHHASLSPGQMVEVSPAGLSPVAGVDTESELAWRTGWIIFQEKPLADVLADLGRYYTGRVITVDGGLGHIRVSGNYRLDDPEGVIRSLAEAAGAKVTRLPGGIIILR